MRSRLWLLAPVLLVPACTASQPGPVGEQAAAEQQVAPAVVAELQEKDGPPRVLPGTDGPALAVQASSALFSSAPVVVLAGPDSVADQGRAASAAVTLAAPLLLAPASADASSAVAAEVERLGTEAVLAVGSAAAAWASRLEGVDVVTGVDRAGAMTGVPLSAPREVTAQDLVTAVAELSRGADVPLLQVQSQAATAVEPEDGGAVDAPSHLRASGDRLGGRPRLPAVVPAEPAVGTVVLTTADPQAAAAVATARAAGADVLVVPTPDPRADGAAVELLASQDTSRVLGLGSAFGPQERFDARVATAATGAQLPGGGQLVLPGKRYVALYGHPGSTALGVLGEQGPEASVERAQRLAREYAAVRQDVPVVPTFEIITTIADAVAGPDGDYSAEASVEHLLPHVEAAAAAGVYVVLDLQPGYTDFLTQARRYEELLALPHVGLALDPEWRLAPGQRHMRQIGSVGADEVNAVGDWLAELVRERRLPQKMLLLHQFKLFMLEDRHRIVADRDEVAVVTQMDGNGPPSTKLDTWRAILRDPPEGMTFGWKNFYDEDDPTPTPTQTLAVEPTPVFVSYQ